MKVNAEKARYEAEAASNEAGIHTRTGGMQLACSISGASSSMRACARPRKCTLSVRARTPRRWTATLIGAE